MPFKALINSGKQLNLQMPQNMIYLFIGHLGIGLMIDYAQIGLVVVDTLLREFLQKNANN